MLLAILVFPTLVLSAPIKGDDAKNIMLQGEVLGVINNPTEPSYDYTVRDGKDLFLCQFKLDRGEWICYKI